MPVDILCKECGSVFIVIPARASTAKFCSMTCKSVWQSKHRSVENHPRWQGGERSKVCEYCGKPYTIADGRALSVFKKQKFCSKPCADKGGLRYFGPDNNKWTGNPRKRHRPSRHAAWARAVISRDSATCRRCGCSGVEMHAHHIVSYKDDAALRWDVTNGETLCFSCHWAEHTATMENGVNSGNTASGEAGGNPEPSHGRKVVEGVTARGRPYRRIDTTCAQCGVFISRRLSDATGKSALFCSMSCASKYRCERMTDETRKKMSESHRGRKRDPHSEETKRKIAEGNRKPKPRKQYQDPTGVISSKSAPRESDDIAWSHGKP